VTTVPILDSDFNNPGYGWEPSFVTASLASGSPSDLSFSQSLIVVPGQEVVVRAYIDNDSTRNAGLDRDVLGATIRFAFNSGSANGFSIVGTVSGSNTPSIWDSTVVRDANQAFRLAYVPGSAKEYTFSQPEGKPLNGPITGKGSRLAAGGTIEPGWQSAACVLITLKVLPA
jgi:hypothetical protein